MASLSQLRGKYYARVYLRQDGKYKEKIIPLHTTDRSIATARLKEVKRKEKKIKQGLSENLAAFQKKHSMQSVMKKYIKDCKQRLGKRTIEVYECALEHLCRALPNYDIEDLKKDDYIKILNYLQSKFNTTTVNIRLRAVKTLLLWAVENDYISKMPMKIKQLKQEKTLPKFFSPKELDAIYKQILQNQNFELCSIVKVYENTGMRLQELFNCQIDGNYIHITRTKGKKERIVPLPEENRHDFDIAKNTEHTHSWISHQFTKYCAQAEIAPGKSLHSLRHTYALKMLLKYGNIYIVKELLGHHSVTTTEIYLKFPMDYLKQIFETRDKDNQSSEKLDKLPINKTVNQIHATLQKYSA
ncbi:MAG: tyrosine-type recombinase/integrase [Candidatus Marinimicrobia bacterium]|nr:tyrosine-type recombinase/integrase [Candidatus Neomarinimicrobiota bacterium]